MSNKKVFAHLLTWFQTKEYSKKWEMWQSDYEGSIHNPNNLLDNSKRDIASTSYPMIDVYDTNDLDVVEYQLLTMKLSGIDGVIIDWDGRNINQYRHQGLMNILPSIKKFGMKIVICFEEWCGYWPISNQTTRQEQIDKAIKELQWMYTNIIENQDYLSINGKHPVLVFRKIPTHWFTSEEWAYIKSELESLDLDFLFNDVYDDTFKIVSDGYFTWVSGFEEDTNQNTIEYYNKELQHYMKTFNKRLPNKLFMGSVMPGFDDSPVNGWGGGTRIAPRYDKQRYQMAWDFMNEYDVEFVQIVTWNDWNEGSQIEPCDRYGYSYINETAKQISKFKKETDFLTEEQLKIPLYLYQLRKENSHSEFLDELSIALNNRNMKEAQMILTKIKETQHE